MARTLYSVEMEKEILRLFDNKLTQQEIADLVGCSESSVHRVRKKFGIKKTPPFKGECPKIRKKEFRDEFIYLYGIKSSDDVCAVLNISKKTFFRYAKTLGLPKRRNRWKFYEHPRGMLGKSHSDEELLRISERSLASWKNPIIRYKMIGNEITQQKRSDTASKNMINRLKNGPNNVYSRAKRGYRDDLGKFFFRSRWEANYARYLNLLKNNGQIAGWDFEPDTFWFEKIKRGVRSYMPDFKITKNDGSVEYHEIKGWMDPKSVTKLKRMAKYHPDVVVVLIDSKAYREIEKSAKPLIPEWEIK